MKKSSNLRLKTMLVLSLICIALFPGVSKANDNIKPNYVRSVYVEVWRPYEGPHIFYEENGYRGWLGVTNSVSVGYVKLRQYVGRIYHPLVKDIPAPTKKEKEVLGNRINDEMLAATKYITRIVTYNCTWKEYWDLKCHIPLSIFYNDGYYKGYLYHKESDPVDIGQTTVRVTYRGTVSRSSYPAPTKTQELE